MRECGRVQNDVRAGCIRLVAPADELSFMVRLPNIDRLVWPNDRCEERAQVVERCVTVNLGLSSTEHPKVWTVEHENVLHPVSVLSNWRSPGTQTGASTDPRPRALSASQSGRGQ